jgi:phosphatidylethanolamine-binding protein (PEBP) family uncharacterized protein
MRSTALAAAALLLATAAPLRAAEPFTLKSSAFADNGAIAKKNGGAAAGNPNCRGENVSPPLEWSNVPEGTKSFALFIWDPEGRMGTGVSHWVAYGIPASVTSLAEGEASKETPKIVDFSLDYLRPGRAQTLYAKCEITKQGKRVANVLIEAWQEDRRKPVAVARAHFLLS